MRLTVRLAMLILAASLSVHAPAFAVSPPQPAYGQQQLGTKLGPGLRIYPELEMLGIYDNNFFFAEDDSNSQTLDSFGGLLRPSLSIIQEGNRAEIAGGARAEIGEFDISDDDDYVDADFFARANYILTRRNRFRVNAEREYGHDPFGLRRTELSDDRRTQPLNEIDRTLDEYRQDNIGAGYRFGARGALFNFDYDFGYVNKNYDNNRQDGTRFLDFDQVRHRGTIIHNYSDHTDLLLVVSQEDLEFDNTPTTQLPRGFRQYRYLVGAAWQATGKTSGRALVGVVDHNPDDAGRNSFTEFDWEVQANYALSAKTRLSVATGREIDESFLPQANFINTQQYTVAWDQRWSPRVATQVVLSEIDSDFEGFNRSDEFRLATLSASWLWTRALAIVGSATYLDRATNSDGRGFEKGVFTLGVKYSP